jgi:RNA polymerase sigma-70 factor (ECF subfamily)
MPLLPFLDFLHPCYSYNDLQVKLFQIFAGNSGTDPCFDCLIFEVMLLETLKSMVAVNDPSTLLSGWMESFGQDVWNYAFFLTKRKDAADDISQDVFLRAYKHWNDFEGRSSVRTWLLTITRNLSLNYLKSSFMTRVSLTGWITSKQTEPSAEKEFMDAAAVSQIWKCVMELPPKYREVLILEFHYQLPRKEMAQLLGLSEGTIKSRLHRARARMETMLKGADIP